MIMMSPLDTHVQRKTDKKRTLRFRRLLLTRRSRLREVYCTKLLHRTFGKKKFAKSISGSIENSLNTDCRRQRTSLQHQNGQPSASHPTRSRRTVSAPGCDTSRPTKASRETSHQVNSRTSGMLAGRVFSLLLSAGTMSGLRQGTSHSYNGSVTGSVTAVCCCCCCCLEMLEPEWAKSSNSKSFVKVWTGCEEVVELFLRIGELQNVRHWRKGTLCTELGMVAADRLCQFLLFLNKS